MIKEKISNYQAKISELRTNECIMQGVQLHDINEILNPEGWLLKWTLSPHSARAKKEENITPVNKCNILATPRPFLSSLSSPLEKRRGGKRKGKKQTTINLTDIPGACDSK